MRSSTLVICGSACRLSLLRRLNSRQQNEHVPDSVCTQKIQEDVLSPWLIGKLVLADTVRKKQSALLGSVCKAGILSRSSGLCSSHLSEVTSKKAGTHPNPSQKHQVDILSLPQSCPFLCLSSLFAERGWENGGGEGIFLMLLETPFLT